MCNSVVDSLQPQLVDKGGPLKTDCRSEMARQADVKIELVLATMKKGNSNQAKD